MGIELSSGGAQAALTTSESVLDLTALLGCTVAIYCDEQDVWFSGAPTAAGGSLITAGASPASKTSLVADRIGAGKKAFRVLGADAFIVAKTVTSTGTLKIKVVSKPVVTL